MNDKIKKEKRIDDKKIDKSIISFPKKECISLADRFKKYQGKNLSKVFKWDEPVGREIIKD
jgi:hypothetical protein